MGKKRVEIDLQALVVALIDNEVTREEVAETVPKGKREEFVGLLVAEKQRRADELAVVKAKQQDDADFLKALSAGIAVTPPESIEEALKLAVEKAKEFPTLINTKAGIIDLAAFSLGIYIWKKDVPTADKKRISELSTKLFEALNVPFKRSTITSHLNDNPVMGRSVREQEMLRAFPLISE